MKPEQKQPDNTNDRPRYESINLNNHDGDIDDKGALKAHSADTPEDLRRVLDEQFGGGSAPVRPDPNNY